jgi:hypothetical protein
VITGFVERKAVAVAEWCEGELVPRRAGQVRPCPQGFVAEAGPAARWPSAALGHVPVRPELVAGVKFFGRYRSGAIRDGVLLSIG